MGEKIKILVVAMFFFFSGCAWFHGKPETTGILKAKGRKIFRIQQIDSNYFLIEKGDLKDGKVKDGIV